MASVYWDLDEDHRDFRSVCRDFVDRQVRPLVEESESQGKFPLALLHDMGKAGLLGLRAPVAFGGSEADSLAVAVLAEELSRASGGLAITALVSAYMAMPHIVNHGSDEQRARWLPSLIDGTAVASIAVTEPNTGSDVAAITTSARRSGDDWVLNGQKMFITNAGIADVLIVAARTGAEGHRGITLFLVDADTPGLEVSAPLPKLGWHSSDTRAVTLDGVLVPNSAVLGELNRGFYQIMEAFQLERLNLAAMGVGHAAESIQTVTRHVQERTAFGHPLAALQTVRHAVGRMRVGCEAARTMTYRASSFLDAGHADAPAAVAQAKYFAARTACEIVDESLQLLGGSGFAGGHAVTRHYRDVRVLRIGGGTDEIQLEILTRDMSGTNR